MRSLRKMLRSCLLLLLVLTYSFHCQEVEIDEEEAAIPPQTSVEESFKNTDEFYKGSPDISSILSFVDPPYGQVTGLMSLVAGKPASFFVSLENSPQSKNVYSLHMLEAALHYPRYFGYHIQNFTVQRLHNTLEPKQQASLYYKFTPSVQLAGQSFDLAVILTYSDQTGKVYYHSLFNSTIPLLEDNEGTDFELIFMCIMIAGIFILTLVFMWHWISSKTGKRSHSSNTSNGVTRAKSKPHEVKKSSAQNKSANANVKERQRASKK